MDKLELRTIHTDTVLAGRYRVEKLLGSGSMGEVYRATDLTTTRTVAVKRIHPYLISDEDAVQRFQREAKALSRLNHPGIVKFHDFYVADGFYFIVLNYLEGQTLEERLAHARQKEKPLPLEETKTILLQLCDALAYAHQQAIVHRDLKPANVMITPQGHAVIMDFGIAKLLDGEQLTGDGLSPGTPGYMSPEIIRGRAIDGRSDIYTLGIILYEMVTGQRPFRGNSRYDTMHSHLFEPIPDVYRSNPKTPPALIHIINTALAKDPDDRFQSVAEMGQALRELDATPRPDERGREPITPSRPIPPPPPPPRFVARPAGQPEEPTLQSRALPASPRSWRPTRLLIALALLPLAFFLVLTLMRRGDYDDPGSTTTLTLTPEDSVQVLPQSLPNATRNTERTPSPLPNATTPGATPTLAPTGTATATRRSESGTVRTNTPSAPTTTTRTGATATSTVPQPPAATATRTPTRTPQPTTTHPPTATATPPPTFTPAPLPSLTPSNTPRPDIDPDPTATPKRNGK